MMSRIPVLLAVAVLLAPVLNGADTPPAKAPVKAGQSRFRDVDVEGFEKLRGGKDVVVLDVRTEKEFQAGHVPGAVLMDVNADGFAAKAAGLDKTKTYLVHCAAGVRSVKACNILAGLGFEKLVNVQGGYRAWEKAGHVGEK